MGFHTGGMSGFAGVTPIPLLTLAVAVLLPLAIGVIRPGKVASHRKTMRNLYLGGCIADGFFTFAPGRLLGKPAVRRAADRHRGIRATRAGRHLELRACRHRRPTTPPSRATSCAP